MSANSQLLRETETIWYLVVNETAVTCEFSVNPDKACLFFQYGESKKQTNKQKSPTTDIGKGQSLEGYMSKCYQLVVDLCCYFLL